MYHILQGVGKLTINDNVQQVLYDSNYEYVRLYYKGVRFVHHTFSKQATASLKTNIKLNNATAYTGVRRNFFRTLIDCYKFSLFIY